MWGTPKSEIILEKEIPLTTSLPENTVRVFDAIVLIQKLPEGVNTFGDVSDHILNRITKNTSLCVFLVSDQYDPASIRVWKEKRDLILVRFEQLQNDGNIKFQLTLKSFSIIL